MPEDFEGPENLNEPPPFFPSEGGTSERRASGPVELIEVQVEGVLQTDDNGKVTQFVFLGDGERRLPIAIGTYEAIAIQQPFEGFVPPRPQTHDLMRSVIERMGGTLERVVIDDLWNGVFYAKLYVRRGKETIEIDSRPSDAVAMAARFQAPIFVVDTVLDQEPEV